MLRACVALAVADPTPAAPWKKGFRNLYANARRAGPSHIVARRSKNAPPPFEKPVENSSWLIRHSGRLLHQETDQAPQQRLTPLADVVNELEESQIQGQLLLRHPPVGTQPRSEQGPEPLDGVDMDFAEAVTILVARELPSGMTDRFMAVTPSGQSSINIIFISVNQSPRGDRGPDQRGDRDLLDVLEHPNHHHPGAFNHADDGRLFLGQRPSPPLPLQPPPSAGPP